MNNNITLDPALLDGQTMGQSIFQAVIIMLFIGFLAWTVKMAFD